MKLLKLIVLPLRLPIAILKDLGEAGDPVPNWTPTHTGRLIRGEKTKPMRRVN